VATTSSISPSASTTTYITATFSDTTTTTAALEKRSWKLEILVLMRMGWHSQSKQLTSSIPTGVSCFSRWHFWSKEERDQEIREEHHRNCNKRMNIRKKLYLWHVFQAASSLSKPSFMFYSPAGRSHSWNFYDCYIWKFLSRLDYQHEPLHLTWTEISFLNLSLLCYWMQNVIFMIPYAQSFLQT
jgi:hypothetical protein